MGGPQTGRSKLSWLIFIAATTAAAAAANAAAAAPPGCAAGGNLAGHALGRPLPANAAKGITPLTPFFIALADMAYDDDFGLGRMSPRRPTGPCLKSWGATADPVHLSAVDSRGGDIHAYVFRTDYDVFVSFRGLADLRDVTAVDSDTNPYDIVVSSVLQGDGRRRAPELANASEPHVAALLGASGGASRDLPPEVTVLEGYALAVKSIMPELLREVAAQAEQLPQESRSSYRIWVTGHSDGSQYAQLAVCRLALEFGAKRVGGVVLLGVSRVGNAAFAQWYNQFLGDVTLRVTYGRDPASEEDYKMQRGLRMVGRGVAFCPSATGRALEDVVELPVGEDRMNVCPGMAPPAWMGRAAQWLGKLGSQLAGAFGSRGGGNLAASSFESAEYLANHLPPGVFDATMRHLRAAAGGPALLPCQEAALRLNQCVVSNKCSAALRPAGAPQCATCGADAACREALGPGWSCDRQSALASGWLCYPEHAPAPGLLGLLVMPSGGAALG